MLTPKKKLFFEFFTTTKKTTNCLFSGRDLSFQQRWIGKGSDFPNCDFCLVSKGYQVINILCSIMHPLTPIKITIHRPGLATAKSVTPMDHQGLLVTDKDAPWGQIPSMARLGPGNGMVNSWARFGHFSQSVVRYNVLERGEGMSQQLCLGATVFQESYDIKFTEKNKFQGVFLHMLILCGYYSDL